MAAEHADICNITGRDLDDSVARSEILDRYCVEIGRDPATITRSLVVPMAYERPGESRDAAHRAVDAGFSHIVLMLPPPYPQAAARWVAAEIIAGSVA